MSATPSDPDLVADAQRARRRHERELRRLGAVGELGIGYDPQVPTWRSWWARCFLRRPGYPPLPLLVDGHPSATDALAALVGEAEAALRADS